jgi:hypothetical protein
VNLVQSLICEASAVLADKIPINSLVLGTFRYIFVSPSGSVLNPTGGHFGEGEGESFTFFFFFFTGAFFFTSTGVATAAGANDVFNQFKKRIIKKSINIDTRFRDNYYATQSTNFNFDLPIKFNNVVSLQLAAFEYSTTAYVISKQIGTNFFWVSANDENQELLERECILIPNGNYTAIDIVSYLNNYVKTALNFKSTKYLQYLSFNMNLGGIALNSGSGQLVVSIDPNIPGDYNSNSFTFSLDFQSDINGNPDYGAPLPLKLGWIFICFH